MNRLEVKTIDKRNYEIVLNGSFEGLADELKRLGLEKRRAFIISDTNVAPLYLDQVKNILESLSIQTDYHILPAGEESKTQDNAMILQNILIENNYKRTDIVIALGGGVIGDIS